ncbi:MAG TPA: hypothetical protein VGB59_06720 [Allosphingosinicella sp.]|jgi:hypothetical protein
MHRLKRYSLPAFLALTWVSTAALGQEPSDKKGARDPAEAVYRVGACLVDRDRQLAARLLDELPLGDESADAAIAAASASGCGDPRVKEVTSMVLRGALAQRLYRIDFPNFGEPPRSLAKLVRLELPVEADEGEARDRFEQLYRWSDCVVRNAPEHAAKLVASAANSRQERRLFNSLGPTMVACRSLATYIPTAAVTLRSLLAQSTYDMFRRYWAGEIRHVGGNAGEPIVCRSFSSSGSRVQKDRFCMTKRMWEKVGFETRQRMANEGGLGAFRSSAGARGN